MRKDRQTAEYREQNRKYQNEWYHANKKSALATRKKRLDKLREQFKEYKSSRGCNKCGETHPYCLELHRSDPSVKDLNPSEMLVKKGWSFERLKEEFDKLEILCANCHRKVHYSILEQ